MSAANPSWYDLLGVDESASADEIRAAWKSAIGELDPTDRRFRVLNQAAEVLLDPEERAAYDEALAPDVSAASEAAEPAVEAPPPPPSDPATAAVAEPDAQSARPPAWLLAGLGFLAAVLVGLCVWQAQKPSDQDIADSTDAALQAAGPAVAALLSYDYRDLDATKKAAEAAITEDYRKTSYAPFFDDVIATNAVDTKSIVKSETRSVAITRAGADRVQVFVLVDRVTTNKATTEPVVYRDSATLTMEHVGDEWLIDKVDIGQ